MESMYLFTRPPAGEYLLVETGDPTLLIGQLSTICPSDEAGVKDSSGLSCVIPGGMFVRQDRYTARTDLNRWHLLYPLASSIHLGYTVTMDNQGQVHSPDIDRSLKRKEREGSVKDNRRLSSSVSLSRPLFCKGNPRGIRQDAFRRQHSSIFDGLGEQRNMLSATAVCGWHDLRLGPRSSPSSSPAAVRRPSPSPRNCGCHSASHHRRHHSLEDALTGPHPSLQSTSPAAGRRRCRAATPHIPRVGGRCSPEPGGRPAVGQLTEQPIDSALLHSDRCSRGRGSRCHGAVIGSGGRRGRTR